MALGKEINYVFFSNMRNDDENHIIFEKGIKVRMNSLANLFPQLKKINFLKIDVEGYEKFVIEGAIPLLDRIEAIYFECYERNFSRYGYNSQDLFQILHSYNFRTFELNNEKYKEIILEVLKMHDVQRASLFGSIVRDEMTDESDIDILIEFKGVKSLLDLAGLKIALEEALASKVDVLTYDSIHPLLKEQILAEQVEIL